MTALAELFRLEPDHLHVWSLRLDLSPGTRGRLERVLAADEAARARRFLAAADRTRFAVAHGLLRVVLSGYLNTRPEDVALETAAGGKPRVAGGAGPSFSLSHSGALGLVAVSAGGEVGVDLEGIRDVGDVTGLAATCFSPVEQAALAALPAARRQRAFFTGWSRKEAFLKVLGEGLSRPLDSFDVSLAPGVPARVLRVAGAPEAAGQYSIRSWRPAPGYVGSVAVASSRPSVRFRSWQSLSALVQQLPAPASGSPSRSRRSPAGERARELRYQPYRGRLSGQPWAARIGVRGISDDSIS